MRSIFLAARTACTIGKLFKNEAMIAQGKKELEELPSLAQREGLRMSTYLKAEIDGEFRGCILR